MVLRAARSRTVARLDRRPVLVVAMALAMAGAAVALWCCGLGPGPSARVLPWWALAVAFVATEVCARRVQVRREGELINICELPLVLALFFAGPTQLFAGRLLGIALFHLVIRRTPLLKTAWNLALVALQTAVTAWVFDLVAGGHGVTDLLGWLGAFAGPVAANVLGTVAIAVVVGIHDGGVDLRRTARALITDEVAVPIVITFALVAGITVHAYPPSAVLVLVLGTGVLVGYRLYGGLAERHLSLERLYRFTQAVTSSPEVDHVLGSVLAQARELLHAERAAVFFVGATEAEVAEVRLGAGDRLTHAEGSAGPEDERLLERVVGRGEPVLLQRATRDVDDRRWLDSHGVSDAIAVPLRGTAGVLGTLVVTDRLGDVRSFDASDVQLLETVANHGSVALQNRRLIDEL